MPKIYILHFQNLNLHSIFQPFHDGKITNYERRKIEYVKLKAKIESENEGMEK